MPINDKTNISLNYGVRPRYNCWDIYRYLEDIYEEINGEFIEIGFFLVCHRRYLPLIPDDIEASSLKAWDYSLPACARCQYEFTDKWPKSICLLKNWKHWGRTGQDIPITNLTKSQLLSAIKKYIERDSKGSLYIVNGEKYNETNGSII